MHINLDLYENIDDITNTINELSDLKLQMSSTRDVATINDAVSILTQIINEGK